MTHERFYCHRGFAAATSHHAASTVWWQAASPLGGVNRLFQVCLPSWRLRAGVPIALSRAIGPTNGDCALSRQTVMQNAG